MTATAYSQVPLLRHSAAGRRALPGLVLGLLAAAVRAQPAAWPVPYEQVGIVAEVSAAANGVAARDQAYREAMRLAWLRLKLALARPLVRATDSEISDMVAAILVEQERVSPHGYHGRLTVRFDPWRVAAVAGIAPPDLPEPPAPPEAAGAPPWQESPGAAPMPGPDEDAGEPASPPDLRPMPGGAQAPFWFRW